MAPRDSADTMPGVILSNTEPAASTRSSTAPAMSSIFGTDLRQTCHQRFLGNTAEDSRLHHVPTQIVTQLSRGSRHESTRIDFEQITGADDPFVVGCRAALSLMLAQILAGNPW